MEVMAEVTLPAGIGQVLAVMGAFPVMVAVQPPLVCVATTVYVPATVLFPKLMTAPVLPDIEPPVFEPPSCS